MKRPCIKQQITFLYTQDLAASTVFYEDILALPLALDQGRCRIYRLVDSGYVGICETMNAVVDPKGIMLTLVVPDVDAWYAYLSRRGVTFETPPSVNETYGIYHCIAKDPNGYLIEVQRFLHSNWDAQS